MFKKNKKNAMLTVLDQATGRRKSNKKKALKIGLASAAIVAAATAFTKERDPR